MGAAFSSSYGITTNRFIAGSVPCKAVWTFMNCIEAKELVSYMTARSDFYEKKGYREKKNPAFALSFFWNLGLSREKQVNLAPSILVFISDQLTEPLEFNDQVGPIKLADNRPEGGAVLKTSGWGLTDVSSLWSYIRNVLNIQCVVYIQHMPYIQYLMNIEPTYLLDSTFKTFWTYSPSCTFNTCRTYNTLWT